MEVLPKLRTRRRIAAAGQVVTIEARQAAALVKWNAARRVALGLKAERNGIICKDVIEAWDLDPSTPEVSACEIAKAEKAAQRIGNNDQIQPCWKKYVGIDYDNVYIVEKLLSPEKWCDNCLRRNAIQLEYRKAIDHQAALKRAMQRLAERTD